MSAGWESIPEQHNFDKNLDSKQQTIDKMVKIAVAGGSSSKSWVTMGYIFVPLLIAIQMSLRR